MEAIFKDGVFKPAKPPELADGQRVKITVETVTRHAPDEVLRIASEVYQGLSASDVEEIDDSPVFFTREST